MNHRCSGRVYELLLLNLSPKAKKNIGTHNGGDFVDPIKEVRTSIYQDMKNRCELVQNRVYPECGFRERKAHYWRFTGNERRPIKCYENYEIADPPKTMEHELSLSAQPFGSADVVSLFEIPDEYWSKYLTSKILCQESVSSCVSVPLFRYKSVAIRNKNGIYAGEFQNCRFSKPIVLLSFIELEDFSTAPEYCNWVIEKFGVASGLRKSFGNHPGVLLWNEIHSDYKEFAVDEEWLANEILSSGKSLSLWNQNRIEVFFTLLKRHPVLVKAEFDNLDDLILHMNEISNLQKTDVSGGMKLQSNVVGMEPMLALNFDSDEFHMKLGNNLSHSSKYKLVVRCLFKTNYSINWRKKIIDPLSAEGLNVVFLGSMPQYHNYCGTLSECNTYGQLSSVFKIMADLSAEGIKTKIVPIIQGQDNQTVTLGLVKVPEWGEKEEKETGDDNGEGKNEDEIRFGPYPWAYPATFRREQILMEGYNLQVRAEWIRHHLVELREQCLIFKQERLASVVSNLIKILEKKVMEDLMWLSFTSDSTSWKEDSGWIEEAADVAPEASENINIIERLARFISQRLRTERGIFDIVSMISHELPPRDFSGAMDLHIQAAENVIDGYFDISKETEPWKGVVVVHLGMVLSAHPETEMIFLPVSFQFLGSAMFPLLAHEIGHIIIDRNLTKYIEGFGKRKGSNIVNKLRRNDLNAWINYFAALLPWIVNRKGNLKDYNKEIDSELIEVVREGLKKIRPEGSDKLNKRILKEIVSDIIATILAGTAYGIALHSEMLTLQDWSRIKRRTLSTTLKARLHITAEIAKRLHHGWQWQKMLKSITKLDRIGAPDSREEIEVIDCFLNCCFPYNSVSEDDMRDEIRWSNKSFKTCLEIAKTIGVDDALALSKDWSKAQIAAGVQFSDFIKRPNYPSGRVILSLAHHS